MWSCDLCLVFLERVVILLVGSSLEILQGAGEWWLHLDFIDAFAGIQVSVTSLGEHTYEDECNKREVFLVTVS